AWDGDYDRCFFFDEHGQFIEGYYLVGLLAEVFLKREPGARIVHDPRLTWNTQDIVLKHGGVPVLCKSGHAFIKQKMREVDGAYGGEVNAHHYFPQFFYCWSGMNPLLPVLQVPSERRDQPAAHWRPEGPGGCGKRNTCPGEGTVRGPGRQYRLHRWPVAGIPRMAVQSARLEHGTPGAPQRR